MQNPEIVIIGAAIIDVLAYPVNVKVFETGSYSTEDIHMTTGADALNEATILAKKGRRVQLETVIGQDDAGKYAGYPDVPFRLQASEVPGVCRSGLDEFLEGRGSLCIHADVG